jgi:hypothetical protein
MSTQDSPNIPRKRSRFSQEGTRGTPSSTETLSDQQKSRQRRLSNESVNRSNAECAQESVMDATFLDILRIDTPTPKNVGNTLGQENIFGNFLCFDYFCCIFVYLNSCQVKCCNYFQMCV